MSLAPKSILYAEDDENDAFFMERAFEHLQMLPSLHTVSDGQMAIDHLSSLSGAPLPLRLVLLDVKMPRLTGLDVLKWIRQQAVYAGLPVVILTSSTQDKDVAAAAAHGANAYLVKPSNAENLRDIMKKLLDLSLKEPRPAGRFSIEGNQLP